MQEIYFTNRQNSELPSSCIAMIEALFGIYTLKMIVFLSEEKESYRGNEKDYDKVQKKIRESLVNCAKKLKNAIFMYPAPEFSSKLFEYINKYYKMK